MKELKFYKKKNSTWWVDLPEYIAGGGDPMNLQMVLGADVMLDSLSGEKAEVKLQVSEQKAMSFPSDFHELKRVDEIPTPSGKYYYDENTELLMWLCDVMLWIFEGRFPETIWYKKV